MTNDYTHTLSDNAIGAVHDAMGSFAQHVINETGRELAPIILLVPTGCESPDDFIRMPDVLVRSYLRDAKAKERLAAFIHKVVDRDLGAVVQLNEAWMIEPGQGDELAKFKELHDAGVPVSAMRKRRECVICALHVTNGTTLSLHVIEGEGALRRMRYVPWADQPFSDGSVSGRLTIPTPAAPATNTTKGSTKC